MNIFESFKESQLNESLGDTYIKRKGSLLKYGSTDSLLVKDQMISVEDFSVYSFFKTDDEMGDMNLIKYLRYFEFYYELLNLDKKSSLEISKAARTAIDKIAATRYPSNDFKKYFEELLRVVKKNVTGTYLTKITATHKWYSEDFNNIPAIKDLSLKTNISCEELGAIFDVKYIYILSILSNKVSDKKLGLEKF